MKLFPSICVATFLVPLFFSCSTTSSPQGFMKKAEDSNRNSAQLTQLKKELCEKGSLDDCADYGMRLWVEGDTETAKKILTASCEKDHRKSCLRLGQLDYRLGNLGEAQTALADLCNEKPGIECSQAGEIAAIQGNQRQALGFYKKACQAGLDESCVTLGRALRIQNHAAEATLVLRKACDHQKAPACTELAMIQWSESKEEAALQLLDQDCERQSDRACRWASVLRLKRADSKFASSQEQNCKNGEKPACRAVALLQLMRKGGRNLALHKLKMNCEAGDLLSCWDRLVEINGIKPDRVYADEIDALCKKDVGIACYHDGFVRKNIGEIKEAYTSWSKACEKGVSWGCQEAAQDPDLSDSDRNRFLKMSCDQGLQAGCKDLGSELYWAGKTEEAAPLVKAACPNQSIGDCLRITTQSSTLHKLNSESLDQRCDQGDSSACYEYGIRLTQEGKPIEAKASIGKSCDLGEGDACAFLGKLAEKAQIKDEAKTFYRKACDLNSTLGCKGMLELMKEAS